MGPVSVREESFAHALWYADRLMNAENGASHVVPGSGARYWGPGGDHYEFLVTGTESGCANFVLCATVPVGGGPPLHAHSHESESFYLIEGKLAITIGDQVVQAQTGDFVHIPRGVLHTYANEGTSAVKMIAIFAPAGMEGWFQEVLVPVEEGVDAPVYTPEQLGRMIEAGPRHGVVWG
jgi:quercetin dioxygenase-like cupin family protein